MRRASAAECDRLNETFAALCRIESPTGRERACADRVRTELEAVGLRVDEDGAGPLVGADAGNLFVRIPGRGSESIMFGAHMDTVPPLAPIEPVRENGGWRNANEAILGADNKAAVAVLLAVARRLAHQPAECGVELLFTVSEETGLHGAKAFDVTRLQSRSGYVFDHATPIGEIIVASPTYQRVEAQFRGQAAHAGLRPETGRSAVLAAARAVAGMHLGRIDRETTANVGTISGGTATNVVPERCTIEAEVRGLDDGRVEAVLTEMIDRCNEAANATEVDLDVIVTQMFKGYRKRSRSPEIELAERALGACGYEPRQIVTGGGSDANAFEAKGFTCTNLADGSERNHEPGERISTDALEGLLEVALALVEEAGRGV